MCFHAPQPCVPGSCSRVQSCAQTDPVLWAVCDLICAHNQLSLIIAYKACFEPQCVKALHACSAPVQGILQGMPSLQKLGHAIGTPPIGSPRHMHQAAWSAAAAAPLPPTTGDDGRVHGRTAAKLACREAATVCEPAAYPRSLEEMEEQPSALSTTWAAPVRTALGMFADRHAAAAFDMGSLLTHCWMSS